MANFFEKAKDNAKALEQSILGPDYKYYDYIKSPEDMGMSSDGSISAITRDVSGIINYVTILSSGGGPASRTGQPLGNKFFLETGATCKDTASGENVTRSLYINNVPDGSIPFLSAATGVRMDSFKGLIPGTLSNLAQINPMQIFGAFMEGSEPECQSIIMETIDVNNKKSYAQGFVTNNDISNMNPNWFSDNKNPVTGKQGFTTLRDATLRDATLRDATLQDSTMHIPSDAGEYKKYITSYNKKYRIKNTQKVDYSIMPNDGFAKLYYTSVGLLLLYIFAKMFRERN
jgi:hypothetical protein